MGEPLPPVDSYDSHESIYVSDAQLGCLFHEYCKMSHHVPKCPGFSFEIFKCDQLAPLLLSVSSYDSHESIDISDAQLGCLFFEHRQVSTSAAKSSGFSTF